MTALTACPFSIKKFATRSVFYVKTVNIRWRLGLRSQTSGCGYPLCQILDAPLTKRLLLAHAIKLFVLNSIQLKHSTIAMPIMLHGLVKGVIVERRERRVFFFRSMSNCFRASLVIADCISFQMQCFKQSQADAVKSLLNSDLIKNCFAPRVNISADAHDER